MSPVPQAISVGSVCSVNQCGDPRGVRSGIAHFLVALHHWVTLGWCRQWREGKRVDFTVDGGAGSTAAILRPCRAAPIRGRAGRHARHPHRLRKSGCACFRCPSPPPPTSWGIFWRPRRPPRYSGQRWALSSRTVPLVVLRYACLLACYSVMVKMHRLIFNFSSGGAKTEINN